MDLQFIQIEQHLLNATYWNYDLYNTEEYKDNWNLENFSLLGPNRIALCNMLLSLCCLSAKVPGPANSLLCNEIIPSIIQVWR